MGPISGISRIEAAPNGYLNVFLDRPAFLCTRLGLIGALPTLPPALCKTIVEHTAINPNKAAHIGHLRNAALGDTLVRVLRFRGTPVEVQNYIDDTGVQVADVVVGFQALEPKSLDEVRALADSSRFDYYCWDLYARVTEWYEEDKERLKVRAEVLHAIERQMLRRALERHSGVQTRAAAELGISERVLRYKLRKHQLHVEEGAGMEGETPQARQHE